MDVASVVLWVHGEYGLHFVTDGPQHLRMYSIIGFDNTTSEPKDAPVSCKGTDVGSCVGCGQRTSSGRMKEMVCTFNPCDQEECKGEQHIINALALSLGSIFSVQGMRSRLTFYSWNNLLCLCVCVHEAKITVA